MHEIRAGNRGLGTAEIVVYGYRETVEQGETCLWPMQRDSGFFKRRSHVTKCYCLLFSAPKFIERMTASIKRARDIRARPT